MINNITRCSGKTILNQSIFTLRKVGNLDLSQHFAAASRYEVAIGLMSFIVLGNRLINAFVIFFIKFKDNAAQHTIICIASIAFFANSDITIIRTILRIHMDIIHPLARIRWLRNRHSYQEWTNLGGNLLRNLFLNYKIQAQIQARKLCNTLYLTNLLGDIFFQRSQHLGLITGLMYGVTIAFSTVIYAIVRKIGRIFSFIIIIFCQSISILNLVNLEGNTI